MRVNLRSIVVLVALTMSAAACGGGNVHDLAVGDCFQDPEDGTTLIVDVDTVDCSEPHDNEVFHIYEIDTLGTEDSYFEDCVAQFTSYVGSDYATSEIFVSSISPTAEGFAEGDNEVICIAFLEPPNRLTGTVKDSGR